MPSGEGTISAGENGRVICQGCGGHLGPTAPFARWGIGRRSNLGAKAVEKNLGSNIGVLPKTAMKLVPGLETAGLALV